jgi:putative transcriptional regulator
MEIKCRLKILFAEREIKQTEFAKKAGIGSNTLSLLVKGHRLPSLEVAYKIAHELDLNVMEIWKIEEDNNPVKGMVDDMMQGFDEAWEKKRK